MCVQVKGVKIACSCQAHLSIHTALQMLAHAKQHAYHTHSKKVRLCPVVPLGLHYPLIDNIIDFKGSIYTVSPVICSRDSCYTTPYNRYFPKFHHCLKLVYCGNIKLSFLSSKLISINIFPLATPGMSGYIPVSLVTANTPWKAAKNNFSYSHISTEMVLVCPDL